MAFATKFALDFMSQQRIAQHTFLCRVCKLYGPSRLPPLSKTQCRTRNISVVASKWPRQRSHCQQKRANTVSILESDDSKPMHVDKAPSLNTSTHACKKNDTLHSRVHYILKIPVGKIGKNNLAKARSFLYIVSKWHNEQGAKLSEALLERLHEEHFTGGNGHAIIDSEMYNVCMDAWNKSNVNGEKIVNHVEAILKRMEERSFRSEEHNAARPDRYSYNCLINAYSKLQEEDSSDKVEGILDKMTTLSEEAASSDNAIDEGYEQLIRPDEYTYNSLMNYYATRKNIHLSAQRAEDLLLRMSELSREGKIQMDTTSFNIVLKAWSNSGSGIHGAQRAESLLRMMMKLFRQGHENLRPDAVSFSTVISSYAKVDPEDACIAVEKTMELLDEFEGSFIVDTDTNIDSCYNAAANTIVKSGSHSAVDQIKELMNRMKNVDAAPSGKIKTSIIEAYANLGSEDALRQGIEILLGMMNNQNAELEEDSVVPFNILLNAILKGNFTKKIELAEELISEMDEVGGNSRPDLQSYNMIISALSRSAAKDPEHENKAVSFMRKMLKSYSNGYLKAKPDSFIFNCIISMLARSKQQEWADDVIYRTLMAMESQVTRGNASVNPDTITYNLVIGKLAKAGTKQNAKKVMKLLTSMEKADASAPDIITYTNVLQILKKVDPLKAADVASSYLERAMSNGKPMQVDRLGFQTLLLALSQSHEIDHALLARKVWTRMENSDRAEADILDSSLCNLVLIACFNAKAPGEALSFLSERIQRFKSLHEEDAKNVILPTVVGFSAALASLGKANKIGDALGLLEIMKALDRDGVPNTKPDEGCYNSVLSHLARNPARNNAAQALRIIRRMRDDLEHVSIASLNSAINICSRTMDESPIARRKAIEITFQLFQLGRESKSFNTATFALMIRTCIKLTDGDDAQLRLVKPLFKLCAQNGLVGSMVMREIGHLKKYLIRGHQLPKEWTVNVGKER